MKRFLLIPIWAIGGTVAVIYLLEIIVQLLGLVGIASADPSGRLSIGNVPVGIFVCGPAPIALIVLLILGFAGKLPGTRIVIRDTMTPSQYWKCPSCGYDMSSIKSDLCPECGESLSMMRNR